MRGIIVALVILVGCSSTAVTACTGDPHGHSTTTTCTTHRY